MIRKTRLASTVVVLALALPGAASAAVLSGSANDPVGDSIGSADIARVTSSYDTGELGRSPWN